MQIRVMPDIAKRYPDLRIGVIWAGNIDNHGLSQELEIAFEAAYLACRERYKTIDELSVNPQIQLWRNIYQSMQVKVKDYRPVVEATLRRVIKGKPIPFINKAVNAYLLTVLEYHLPIGGYDVKHVKDNIYLRISAGEEPFTPIGGNINEPTIAGEIIYADSESVLTRLWNYKDADKTKITEDSDEILLCIEAADNAVHTSQLRQAVQSVAANIIRFCSGFAQVGILNVQATDSISLTELEAVN